MTTKDLQTLNRNSTWEPTSYRTNSKHVTELALDYIKALNTLEGDEYLLDAGCGEGSLTNEILMLLPHGKILGIDQSDKMITSASYSYQANNLNFDVCKMEKLSYQTKFDVITSFSVLQWVENVDLVLKNIYESLKQEGKFIGILWPRGDLYWFPVIEVASTSKWKDYFKDYRDEYMPYGAAGVNILLKKAGFSVHECEEKFIPYKHTEDTYETVLKCFSPFLPFIPARRLNEFLNDVKQYLDSMMCKDSNGFYSLPARAMFIFASKEKS